MVSICLFPSCTADISCNSDALIQRVLDPCILIASPRFPLRSNALHCRYWQCGASPACTLTNLDSSIFGKFGESMQTHMHVHGISPLVHLLSMQLIGYISYSTASWCVHGTRTARRWLVKFPLCLKCTFAYLLAWIDPTNCTSVHP